MLLFFYLRFCAVTRFPDHAGADAAPELSAPDGGERGRHGIINWPGKGSPWSLAEPA